MKEIKSPAARIEKAKEVLQSYLDVDKTPLKGNEWILDAMCEYAEKHGNLFTHPSIPSDENNKADEYVTSKLRDNWLNEDEVLTDDEIVERFPDEWGLGMDCYKQGAKGMRDQIGCSVLNEEEIKTKLNELFPYDSDNNFDKCITDAKRQGFMKSLSLRSGEWVSVADKLPPKEGKCFSYHVLTIDEKGYIETGCYDYEFNRWNQRPHAFKITHWMPLPSPPTK